MKPIEYLESLALEGTKPYADGDPRKMRMPDYSAKRALEDFQRGDLSEDDAVVAYMKHQNEIVESLRNQLLHYHSITPSQPIINTQESSGGEYPLNHPGWAEQSGQKTF